MPEGPEIHRAVDALAAAVEGEVVTAATLALPALRRNQHELVGRRIESIRARGKAVLIRFDHGRTLYSHNQLYGVWKIVAPGERPETSRQLRVALDTARASILLYSASDIEWLRDDEVESHPYIARLGPDLLDPQVSLATVRRQLSDARFQRRSLAALLLDQGFLAGMGNYLRAEVLFRAGVAPERKPSSLGDGERERLAEALLELPRWSYRSRGVERIGAGMRNDLQVDHGPCFRFAVFGRDGQPCPNCNRPIERIEIAGRRLYLCRNCQR